MMDEKAEYTAIMRKEVTRYSNLPWWRVLKRTRQMARVRTAAADVSYAGSTVTMPPTARIRFWAWLWDNVIDTMAAYTIFWVVVILSAIGGFAWVCVVGVSALDSPSKPLAPGITQRGFTYTIPPGYIQRVNYGDADPDELCDRLPDYGSYDDFEMTTAKDGTIVIVCDPNKSN